MLINPVRDVNDIFV